MNALLVLAALATVPQCPVIEDTATIGELNHFYDDEGNPVFSQNIWYDDDGLVIDYRITKRPPIYLRDGSLLLSDGGDLRRIRTTSRRETCTQHDPELNNRQWLAMTDRRLLHKSRVHPSERRPGPAPPPAQGP